VTDAGPDPQAFAQLLVGYCLEVQERQTVLVRSTPLAAPLLLEVQGAILQRGAWPLIRVEVPGAGERFYGSARDEQLDYPSEAEEAEAKKIDASLSIQAPADVFELADVDPATVARVARGRRGLRERTLKRRWCSTLWPTEALALRAGMVEGEFAAFVERALFLDRPDPVASWAALGAFQEDLIARVSGARTLRIEAEGTDLTLSVAGRTWVNSDGRRNMPSGEVFTGPREDSAHGTIRFDVPSSPAGVDVRGVDLTFAGGEVVSARAAVGDEYLQRMLGADDGARRLGEVGIGTNGGIDRPIGAILFDEKIGGTVHVALGRSYPETGGRNVSAIHWDLIRDLRRGGRLSADGVVVQEDGRFA